MAAKSCDFYINAVELFYKYFGCSVCVRRINLKHIYSAVNTFKIK